MQTITIEAATRERAAGLYEALSGFRVELRETDDGRRYLEVDLGADDCEIVDVLNAIEDYVTHRACGPARVGFNGRSYALHARRANEVETKIEDEKIAERPREAMAQ